MKGSEPPRIKVKPQNTNTMENEIKIELNFIEAITLKSALNARINQISRETRSTIEYRMSTIQTLMQCYDKVNEKIEQNLKE